jgi:hypothetical protein
MGQDDHVTQDEEVGADSCSLGLLFRQQRERQGLTCVQVAERLCLHVNVIRTLESDLPVTTIPTAYFVGHCRSYARFLGLDKSRFEASLRDYMSTASTVQDDVVAPLKPRFSAIVLSKKVKLNYKYLFMACGLVAVFIVVKGYAVCGSRVRVSLAGSNIGAGGCYSTPNINVTKIVFSNEIKANV